MKHRGHIGWILGGLASLWLAGIAQAGPPPVDPARLPPRGLEAYGWTNLHWVARTGSAQAVREALGDGRHLEAGDTLQRTPIHLAVLAVNAEAVQVLIEAGADVNARDQWGVTPLRRAELLRETRGWDMEDVASILREHGARKPTPPVRPTLPTE